jgi:hypothetical protein
MPPVARHRKDALVAIALKSLHSRKDPIVHRVRNILLAAQVFFRRLNRGVPEQKLYLLKIASGLPAQFCACAPQIVGRQVLDADLVRVMQHDLPDRRRAERGARHLVVLSHRPKYPSLGDFRSAGPEIEPVFDPARNRHQAKLLALADEIGNHPAIVAHLDLVDEERH